MESGSGPVIPSASFLAYEAFPGVLGMGWGKTNFPDTCPLYLVAPTGFAADGLFLMPPNPPPGKLRIKVDWNRNGIVERSEQNHPRKTDPGLVLLKSDTNPVKLRVGVPWDRARFTLHLPADQNLIKVKIDGVEKTGDQPNLTKKIQITVESANVNTGFAFIAVSLDRDPSVYDVLYVWIVPAGLAIVPVVDFLPVMPRNGPSGDTVTLRSYLDGQLENVTWNVTNGGNPATDAKIKDGDNWVDQKQNANAVKLSTGDRVSSALDCVTVTITKQGHQPASDSFTIFKLTIDNPLDGGDGLINDPAISGDPPNGNNLTGNEFTYSTASPGVLEIPVRLTILPNLADLRTAFADKVRIRISNINDSHTSPQGGNVQMAWDNPFPGEATASKGVYDAADQKWKAKVTFTTLPPNNSDFGKKTVTVNILFVTVPQPKTVDIEVFWPLLLNPAGERNDANFAKNHPGPDLKADASQTFEGEGAANRCPNWFYYWRQVVGTPADHALYDNTIDNVIPFVRGQAPAVLLFNRQGPKGPYTGQHWTILISPYASVFNERNNTHGIDVFGDVILHENHHAIDQSVEYIKTAWGLNINGASNVRSNHWSFNIVKARPPAMPGEGTLPRVYNHYTNNNGVPGDDLDTDGDEVIESVDIPNNSKDIEGLAQAAEIKVENRLARSDWGNPGKNHATDDKYDD